MPFFKDASNFLKCALMSAYMFLIPTTTTVFITLCLLTSEYELALFVFMIYIALVYQGTMKDQACSILLH